MQLPPGVTTASPHVLAQIRDTASAPGVVTFELKTDGRNTRAAFFEAVRHSLPLDPPLVGSEKWDALADSVSGGLINLRSSRVVITWPDATTYQESAPEEFHIATQVLRDITEMLADPEMTCGEPKHVTFLLA